MRQYLAYFIITLFCFFSSPSSNLYGQYCGTKITPSDIRTSFLKELKKTHSSNIRSKIKIPIKIYFVKRDDNVNIDLAEIEAKIDAINKAFETTEISFFLCGLPEYIKGKTNYNYSTADLVYKKRHKQRALNIYVVGKLTLGGYSPVGFARFFSYVFLTPKGFKTDETIIHEIGHYFGLLHTHDTFFGKELVDGSNCQEAGDFICDTPADPNLDRFRTAIQISCTYNQNNTDSNGDIYMPDVHNYMSYAPEKCQNRFSNEQIEKMNGNINRLFTSVNPNCLEIQVEEELQIFPNPINQTNLYLHLKNDLIESEVRLTLSTVEGKLVKRMQSYKDKEEALIVMNVADIPKGLYFLTVNYVESDLIFSYKVFKN